MGENCAAAASVVYLIYPRITGSLEHAFSVCGRTYFISSSVGSADGPVGPVGPVGPLGPGIPDPPDPLIHSEQSNME